MAIAILLAGCSKNPEDTAAYQAACHGAPLRSVEQREKALNDGYSINRQYNCIDRASFDANERQLAEWTAANTPEAIAHRKAASAAQRERNSSEQSRWAAAAEENKPAEAPPAIVLRDVDVNTASEADIANVITLDAKVAAQIINERNRRRFSDWADLIHRVTGLSAAQPAVNASICGLTVDGQSLEGAQPNPAVAAMLKWKHEGHR